MKAHGTAAECVELLEVLAEERDAQADAYLRARHPAPAAARECRREAGQFWVLAAAMRNRRVRRARIRAARDRIAELSRGAK